MTPYSMSDAEAEFAAASASGDLAAVDAASARIDELDKPRVIPTLLASALWYGQQGLRVFPLVPGTKYPFKGSNGLSDASSNPDIIAGWWESEPEANIGVATGHVVDIIDIDGLKGQRSRVAHWEDIFARADREAIGKVLTPRQGGMHIWVPATGDRSTTGIVDGVDYRGDGGYAIAPPSVITEAAAQRYEGHHAGTYRFLGTPKFSELGG